jgi:phage host-nuclease inhibitor protein Gam
MSKSRIKSPVETIRTRAEADQLVGDIATLKAQEQQITGELNEKITALRREYDLQLMQIAVDLEARTATLQDWSDRNVAEFGARKSIAFTHGEVGWRTGNPALKPLTGWTWDRVLEKLREGGWFAKYLRVKQEVNKELILADRGELGESLKSIGVRVVQAETFYIEPKIESPETRMQEAA